MKTKEKIGAGLLILVIMTNPLTGQYVFKAFDYAFRESAWLTLLGAVYGIGLIAYNTWNSREKNNIPSLFSKTIHQKYKETP